MSYLRHHDLEPYSNSPVYHPQFIPTLNSYDSRRTFEPSGTVSSQFVLNYDNYYRIR